VPDHDRDEPVEDNDDGEGSARPFWSGMLTFGLVSIPVDLLPAHHHTRAPLRMLDADGTPLARRYFCPKDEEEVDAAHLVRGFELGGGKRGRQVVVVTDEELEALAPKKSREIDLRLFVDRDGIDPLYFERSYFLAPGKSSGKAYRLLAAVMERRRRAGIATFVMRDKEYLVAIFAEGGLLRAETLRFAEGVRSARDVGLPKRPSVDAGAVKRLRRAVSARMEKSWNPADLSDPHRPLRELAERKLAQKKDVVSRRDSAAGEPAAVTDLMEVLRQSLAQNDLLGRAARRGTSGKKRSASGKPRRPLKNSARARSGRSARSR
jgi:DNA end-binding protein Ku